MLQGKMLDVNISIPTTKIRTIVYLCLLLHLPQHLSPDCLYSQLFHPAIDRQRSLRYRLCPVGSPQFSLPISNQNCRQVNPVHRHQASLLRSHPLSPLHSHLVSHLASPRHNPAHSRLVSRLSIPARSPLVSHLHSPQANPRHNLPLAPAVRHLASRRVTHLHSLVVDRLVGRLASRQTLLSQHHSHHQIRVKCQLLSPQSVLHRLLR